MSIKMPNRTFTASPARREKVPLLIGLTGPSGGGKTFTALRLATGIQTVSGGEIFFIDTEARRALHYADKFKFQHVPLDAPFGSLDYLAAIQYCAQQGAGVVVIDSMSHEHEGPGGMVDLQDQILTKMAGDDFGKRQRMQMLAWAEPKAKRRALINGILQLSVNLIFCFRAKASSKPGKDDKGRSVVIPQGYVPIAGEEFVFEQTMNALLLPGAGGVPTWGSDEPGERKMIKLPEQFAALRDYNGPLTEKIGANLAKWAAGGDSVPSAPRTEPEGRAEAYHGDQHDGALDDHPMRAKADDMILRLQRAEVLGDIIMLEANFADHKEATPDEIVAEVERAIDTAKRRVRGEA